MQILDLSFATPAENIAFDDVLLTMAERGEVEETLRFWESARIFVVLGRTGKAAAEVFPEVLAVDRVPVLRRSSGGGTVVQGPGCLNFSWILPKAKDPALNDIRRSYSCILQNVVAVLDSLGVSAVIRPLSDLVIVPGEKKFSGNAQRRGRNYILHHGTILYQFDLALISRYLPLPAEQPEYRRGRSHQDFVTNVAINPEKFKNKFCSRLNVKKMRGQVSAPEGKLLDEMIASGKFLVAAADFF